MRDFITAPSWLDRTAKEFWRRVAPGCIREGLLTPTTADLLACGAQAYSTYREAQRKLKEEGRVIVAHTGARKINPYLTVEKQSFEMLARVIKDLGIAQAIEEPDDDLDTFLTGDTCQRQKE